MTIREYTPADGQACRDILISNIPKYFVIEDMENLNKWLKALDTHTLPYASAESIYHYVLEDESNILGCAGFYLVKDENKVQLNWGMIHGLSHNKGLGKLLFNFRVNRIKEIAPERKVTLWTSQHTYKYYEKFGMKVESMIPNGFGYNYDKYIMYLP